ncbi:MAG: hypothetical protein AAGF97_07895 [Planctomycetota bacterium]
MNDDDAFPDTYEQWRHCIEVRGRIRLTPSYISERLEELSDGQHAKTKEFARLYGSDRLRRTIAWFRRAADELSGKRI